MVQYTKRAIEDTFLRMMNEQNLDRITVKDLVEECGVNRNTFYYHYDDIPDLLEKIFLREKDRVLNRDYSNVSYQEALTQVIELLLENRRAISNAYFSKARDVVEGHLKRLGDEFCGSFIRACAKDREIDAQMLTFLTVCYSESFQGAMKRWLTEYDEITKEQFVDVFSRVTLATIEPALEEVEKF